MVNAHNFLKLQNENILLVFCFEIFVTKKIRSVLRKILSCHGKQNFLIAINDD